MYELNTADSLSFSVEGKLLPAILAEDIVGNFYVGGFHGLSCERKDTKNKLKSKNDQLVVEYYHNGSWAGSRTIMPDITSVNRYDNTVVVSFADGTKTSAVLDSEDKFNLEQGISICITKKLLGEDGHSVYNKLIRRALKVMKLNEKAAEAAAKKKEEEKRARELKKARSERRKAKSREAKIEIQKEAYLRAMKEFKEMVNYENE